MEKKLRSTYNIKIENLTIMSLFNNLINLKL